VNLTPLLHQGTFTSSAPVQRPGARALVPFPREPSPDPRPGIGAASRAAVPSRWDPITEKAFTRSGPGVGAASRAAVPSRWDPITEKAFTRSGPGVGAASRCPSPPPGPGPHHRGTFTRSVPVPMIRLVDVFLFVRVKLSQGVTYLVPPRPAPPFRLRGTLHQLRPWCRCSVPVPMSRPGARALVPYPREPSPDPSRCR